MLSEGLRLELHQSGINLQNRSFQLATRINEQGGALLSDKITTFQLLKWQNATNFEGINWREIVLNIPPFERIDLLDLMSDAYRAYWRFHYLVNGELGTLRDLSIESLLQARNLDKNKVGTLKVAFERDPALTEIPLST